MTPEDRIIIRALVNRAIGGDLEAGDRLERTLDEAGLDLGRVFEAMGLDVGAYDASRDADGRQQRSCPCGVGEQPCPGPDGKPLCANRKLVDAKQAAEVMLETL